MHMEFYSIYEVLIKAIPETVLSVYGVFLLSKTKISSHRYFLLCLIHFISIYLLRSICIVTGAVTLFNLMIIIISFRIICKTDIFKILISASIVIIIVLLSELTNLMLLNTLYDVTNVQILLDDPLTRSIWGLPSTILFGSIILIIKLYTTYKTKKQTEN